jgi:glycosyltransferase involved in cell wall biosynthesis
MEAEVAPDVKRVPLRWLRRPIHPLMDALALIELHQLIRRHQFDVVHTHNAKDGILARWAAHLAGVPAIVHTIHNVSFQASDSSLINSFYALQERWAARITDRLFAVSRENSAKYLGRAIGQPAQYLTVYSGLDLSRYAEDGRTAPDCRASLGLPDLPGPWVGWLGRFNRQKDPVTFVRAARLVADAIPTVQFVVCGDDPLRESLEGAARALALALGLADRMHFLGFRRDVVTVLRAVDLVMHSSRYEGMGRLVCEALACERAVAATSVDGVAEVIDSGTRGGLLAPPEQPAALAQCAVRLLNDRALASALARAGREWIVKHASATAMVKVIEEEYERVLGSASRGRGAG